MEHNQLDVSPCAETFFVGAQHVTSGRTIRLLPRLFVRSLRTIRSFEPQQAASELVNSICVDMGL